ncbi:MAG: signal peptide peptidase SppA [Chitinophagaceae bacterium]|nr:MAG: signal peptide peptidase SppA [Chitinophagaceae bacterium]
MKSFFKIFFATILGFFTSLIILFFFGMIMIFAIVSSFSKEEKVSLEPNTILKLDLNYQIPERTSNNPFDRISFPSMESTNFLGLDEITTNIRKAAQSDDVKGIYLNLGIMTSGYATLETIRRELDKFRETGKFVVAYGEMINQRAYYLGSVADYLFLNPVGLLELRGFSSEVVFFKNMFEKLGIEFQVFDAGKYKSASEPFRLEKMSDANREQLEEYIFDVYHNYLDKVATSRNIEFNRLDEIATEFEARYPSIALELDMVDGLMYEDEVRDHIRSKLALTQDEKFPLISLNRFRSVPGEKESASRDRIAVLYAEGTIVDGKGSRDNIGSESFVSTLRKIKEDDRNKALVIRINSPGGSALASEVILREINQVKEKMPVIVTMGNVAASGGYYMACTADKIFAQDFTVTGSIGVFGLLPNMEGFFNEKIGLTFDRVQTGRFSDLGDVSRPLNEFEKEIIQSAVDSIYINFKQRVSDGRGFSMEYTESVSQGRIFSGTMALENQLVDTLGNLSDAIAYAAWVSELETYRIAYYPEQKDPFESLLEGFAGGIQKRILQTAMGKTFQYYQQAEQALEYHPFQARMPFEIRLN